MTVRSATPDRRDFPGAILMGAQSRLLAYHIPLRFFVFAAIFHVAAWLLLAISYGDVADFSGGTGPVLAALHALTLGVLAMTAMGASYQLLSVATGVAMTSLVPSRLSSWFFIPGTALLVTAMAIGDTRMMFWSGGLVVAGMACFVIVASDIFRRSVAFRTTIGHGWGALVCLGLLAASGLILIADFETGFLGTPPWPTRSDLAIGHALLGGFGFMGLLVLGFSFILVPMFALSPPPDKRLSSISLGLLLLALITALSGALADNGLVMVCAAAIGLAGVAVHLSLMRKALQEGMKKRLGLSFVMVKAGWVLLPVSIILGGLTIAGVDGFDQPSLFGFILVFGWLLTFMTGVLQRILPFLASMHAHKQGSRAPRLSEIGHQKITLKLNAICHGIALVLVSTGIIIDLDALILAGSLSGILGALSFLVFTLGVGRHIVGFYSETKVTRQT